MPLDFNLPGQNSPSAGVMLRNETGASIAVGGVAIVDEVQAEAENNSLILGQEGLTAVTTTNMKAGQLAVNVNGAAVADHARGRFCIEHGAVIQINVDTSAIVKGSLLKAANATATLTLATNGTDRPVARALEANGSAAALIWCKFFPNGIPAIA